MFEQQIDAEWSDGSQGSTVRRTVLPEAKPAISAPTASVLVYLCAERCAVTMAPFIPTHSWILAIVLGLVVAGGALIARIDALPALIAIPGLVLLLGQALNRTKLHRLALVLGTPGPGIRAYQESFGAALVAVAVWSLRQQGRIAVKVADGRGWMVRPVWIRRAGGSNVPASSAGWLETIILAHVPENAPIRINEVLTRWLGTDRRDRWVPIVHTVRAELQALADAADGRADASLPAVVDSAFAELSVRWQAFEATEPTLYQALLHECWAAFPPYLEPEY